MEYIVIGICLIAIVAIGARIFFKPKSKATVTPTVSVSPKEDEELSLSAPQGESAHDWVIQVEMLPAEAISEEGSLVEITDSKVLARVNNLIPNLVQAGNAVNNAVQAVEAQGEVLYRAIIPAGAKLTNSRQMERFLIRYVLFGAEHSAERQAKEKKIWGYSSAGSPVEAVNNPRTGNIKIKHHNLSYLGV